MGEIQEHVHRIAPDTLAAMDELVRRVVEVYAPAPPAEAPATPFDLGLEPWQFHSPSHGCDVVAYIDDRNQVRHVPTTRVSEVPRTWLRVWLEPMR